MARFKEEEPIYQKIRKKNLFVKSKISESLQNAAQRCTHMGKICYRSKKEIATEVNAANKHMSKIKQYYYKCPHCSYWHITKREQE